MKKVCFLGGYGGGPECQDRLVGPQRLYVELGTRMEKKVDVSFLHLGNKDEIITRNGIKEVVIKKGILAFFKTITALKKINPDIIHGHGSLNMAMILLIIKKITSKKTIITFTDFKRNVSNNYRLLNRLDAIIVQTEYALEKLIGEGVQRHLIHKITYGIEDKFYHAKACTPIRGLAPKILLYYGDARQERGFHLLLRSQPLFSEDILLLLCIRKFEKGFEPRKIGLLSAKNLKIITVKEYPAPIEDIIKSSDAVVLPFIKNTLEPPLTVMEVSAVGTPLITTNIGGTSEVVAEGNIILDEITPPALAAAIQKTFEKKIKVKPRLYLWEDTVQKIGQVYAKEYF